MIQHCSAGLKPYLFIESPSVLVSSESVNWPGVAKGALRWGSSAAGEAAGPGGSGGTVAHTCQHNVMCYSDGGWARQLVQEKYRAVRSNIFWLPWTSLLEANEPPPQVY